MISFVIPAHNEEAWVGRCVTAVRGTMELVGEPYEVIVVDDASADATASVAQQQGAHVIRVEHQQISATRNAGARQARGDILFFVDADTLVNAPVVQAALRSVRAGAVGGGCVPRFEGRLPLWWRLVYPFAVGVVRLLRLPSGACQFCTRRAFEMTGGFSENHYAAEDALFVTALKRHGRVVVLAEPVVTSGRSLRAHSFLSIARLLARLAFRGPDAFRDRRGLDLWYHPRREKTQ
jgi:glycosyltransferase involved in cell wall biosynthesis